MSSLTVSPAGIRFHATDEVIWCCRLPAGAGLRPMALMLFFVQTCKCLQVRHGLLCGSGIRVLLQPASGLSYVAKPFITGHICSHVTQFSDEGDNVYLLFSQRQVQCRFANNDVAFLVVLN
ncbi:hypothetical protein Pvag_pPag20135 (plasmid) [Pantoea vagans C9-1]|nr:hypothetical protein Pvag_pPag20135 [Pantoea vagans C9-1]